MLASTVVEVKLFPNNRHEDAARALYERIVAQSRNPVFYRDYGVPDSVDGRFEMLLLHSFLVFHRLKGEGEAAKQLGQTLFDLLVFHLDQSVRVSGVGDLGAGRKMKAIGQAFYGRSKAYETGLEAPAAVELREALLRNVYGSCRDSGSAQPSAAILEALDSYLRTNVAALATQPLTDLMAGRLHFEDAEPLADAQAVQSEAQHG